MSAGNRSARSRNQRRHRDHASYTPEHLAEKILISRSALEGERKQVTSDSTPASGIMTDRPESRLDVALVADRQTA